MNFVKKVTQRLRHVRTVQRLLREDGLINTTDLLVATAATVILAAGVGGTVLGTLDDASYGKAQPDGQAIGQAILNFYADTGKWPGQAYHAGAQGQTVILATGATAGSTTPSAYTLPQSANDGLEWTAHEGCEANSGEGWVNGDVEAGSFSAADGTSSITTGTTVLNLNDYLVRQPDADDYPNWAGPYVQEITADPWGRAWVAYLTPLYCAELVTEASGSGDLGYAWLLTGGSNRTITTPAKFSNLDPTGDDAGVNLGKLSTQSAGAVMQ
jgi:hypothetical protein